MTGQRLLWWAERSLLAIGVALAAYCAAILVEARFHQTAPLPPTLTVTQTVLPGDPGDVKAPAPAPTPAAGTLLGRLEAPSVKLSTTVLEGSDDGTLSRGSGHIEDTPFPGQPGNVGIAGHRDTTFRALRNIHVGDALEFKTADRLYRYRISKTWIVGPDDVYVLDPTPEPALTLVTCYPFEYVGHAPRRFIVRADLVAEEARAGEGGTAGKAGR
ncbi:MAG TPA: class D sortase [Vicinamibacterales bacterium]|nr:class D sortase [Vicinamibacterales bacterium]